ncbi:hypothetical protein [Lacihabitans sp. CS3-21]|uniref:hypothetical protein n=1 Tax=Lacihabitans sp. CS3-21 TaxID=2487332 RepID=UPI0020CBD46A|nr:hypothetical protein [Lacihabitans sp. CS3-21]
MRVMIQLTPNQPHHIARHPGLQSINKIVKAIGLLKQPPHHINGDTNKNQQNL